MSDIKKTANKVRAKLKGKLSQFGYSMWHVLNWSILCDHRKYSSHCDI